MSTEPQVIIVGGGPVGIALAIDLAQRNISSLVLERRREIGRIPKGQSLMQRSLEHFYFWHCVNELRAARVLPAGYPIGGITTYESLAGEYWYLPEGLGGIGQYFFQENERLPQYRTEEVLRARAAELPEITLSLGKVVTEIRPSNNAVEVTFVDTDDPTAVAQMQAPYLVGCDGGRSVVRESVGITRETRDFGTRMVLAVFSSTELHHRLERFPERTTYRVLHPRHRGVWQFFGRVKLGETWFYHGPVPASTTTQDTETVRAAIEEAVGAPIALEFEHIGLWDLRIDVATSYRRGRVFIAGDACHTHPPYGGLGLNTGLDDVANLGWKLSANLAGWGGEELLESYSTERQPIFAETGRDLIGAWIDDDAAFFDRFDPQRDAEEFKRAWMARTGGEFAPPWYEPHYEGSPVIVGAPSESIGIHGAHIFKAQPGHHLAPATLSSGRNVYEELGNDLALIAFGVDEEELEPLILSAAKMGIPLRVILDSYEDERLRYGSPLLLVRPDHFVAWCGDEVPGFSATLLRAICGLPLLTNEG
jgi:2-polyprenyl-6-methoxyphenol hydroxylase-like FAD-dependent oxidoreductase